VWGKGGEDMGAKADNGPSFVPKMCCFSGSLFTPLASRKITQVSFW